MSRPSIFFFFPYRPRLRASSPIVFSVRIVCIYIYIYMSIFLCTYIRPPYYIPGFILYYTFPAMSFSNIKYKRKRLCFHAHAAAAVRSERTEILRASAFQRRTNRLLPTAETSKHQHFRFAQCSYPTIT